jgi:hypothetical protein
MRAYFLVTVSAAALALGAGALARYRSTHRKAGQSGGTNAASLDDAGRALTRGALQWFVIPVWTAAGLADWWCHRACGIEDTTGLKETLIHLTMLGEAAVPLIGGLALEVDAPLLGLMIAAFFLHEATAMWDVSYAVTAREVTPLEQHVHSFLEMVPLMGVAFISLLHWPQLRALAGLEVEPAHGLFQCKREPLDWRYVVGTLGTLLTVALLPYLEEALRDWRAHPGQLAPPSAQRA